MSKRTNRRFLELSDRRITAKIPGDSQGVFSQKKQKQTLTVEMLKMLNDIKSLQLHIQQGLSER